MLYYTPRSPSPRHRALMRAVTATLVPILIALAIPPAHAAKSEPSTPAATPPASVRFELQQKSPSVPTDGDLSLSVRSELSTDTPYLEVRFQVLRPGGGVMLQKTEIRHDLPAGTTMIPFERELASLGLRPAAYPVKIRIRISDRSNETRESTIDDTMFLYDPKAPPTPVSVIVRLNGTTRLDSEGRFTEDPAEDSTERDIALALATELGRTGDVFSLAIPPLVLDEWRRAAAAYQVADAEGVREVPEGSASAIEYARALTSIAGLARLDRVELLDVPYANPDLIGLDAAGATADLERHYDRGLSSYLASLEQTPSAGTAVHADRLTPEALPLLVEQGISYAVSSSGSLVKEDRSSATGAYRSQEGTLALLIPDPEIASDLDTQPADALARLFERHTSEEATTPAVVVLDLGRGRRLAPSGVARILRRLRDTPWIETITAADAAASASGDRLRLAEGKLGRRVPPDYWPAVAEGRRWASALSQSAGENDRDAEAAWFATLLSESGAWGGADGSWSLADRGRAFAARATRIGEEILGGIRLQTQNVTLSGRDGEVPVSISNGSERPLAVTVSVSSDTLAFPGGRTQQVQLLPADNYLTFPVDLRSALSGSLNVSVSAGDVVLEEARVEVNASYLDRIALVSGVVIVLIGMLFFIKRRVDRADAAIISSGRGQDS